MKKQYYSSKELKEICNKVYDLLAKYDPPFRISDILTISGSLFLNIVSDHLYHTNDKETMETVAKAFTLDLLNLIDSHKSERDNGSS